MEVHPYHSNITQKKHGASRNYRYVLDVSGFHTLIALCASACCMEIPTPHTISIIWLSPAYDCPHWCEPFSLFDFLSPSLLYFAILSANVSCSRSSIAWVLKVERERTSLTGTWLVVWGRVKIRFQRDHVWKLVDWVLNNYSVFLCSKTSPLLARGLRLRHSIHGQQELNCLYVLHCLLNINYRLLLYITLSLTYASSLH